MALPAPVVLTTIPAEPGWRCAFARRDPDDGPPVELRPVACWAVVEGIPGAKGPEVCPMLRDEGRGLPSLRPVIHGLAGYHPPDYLGLASPDQTEADWEEQARQHLAGT